MTASWRNDRLVTEDERARRFQADLEEILGTGRTPLVEDQNAAYRETLDIAARLAETDFSAESRVRESLRRTVTRRSTVAGQKSPFSWMLGHLAPKTLLLAPAAAAIVMLVIMLAWPGAVATAAETIERLVRQLVLDENTSVRQIDNVEAGLGLEGTGLETEDASEIYEQGGAVIWIAKTTVRQGGDFPVGQLPNLDMQVFPDVPSAREHLGFALREPVDLPDGYSLAKVRVTPSGWALSHYRGPRGPIIIAHVPRKPPHRPAPFRMSAPPLKY